MKFTKSLLVMALVCATPTAIILTGCGGGNSSLAAGTVAGSYTGTYRVTSGPDTNQTGPISLTVVGNGNITGTVTDAGGTSASFSGTANTSSGNFSISGLFGDTGTGGQATGTIRANGSSVTGSGTFALSNGNLGTITFSKVSS